MHLLSPARLLRSRYLRAIYNDLYPHNLFSKAACRLVATLACSARSFVQYAQAYGSFKYMLDHCF